MLKRLIFDLDNTLFPFEEEYWNTVKETFEEEKLAYTKETLPKFKEAIRTYEDYYPMYKKETMRKHLEDNLNRNLTDTFIDTWIRKLQKCAPKTIEPEVIETLKYLYQKYEMIVLTNWFTDQQQERIKNASLAKYFQKVIGTDTVLNKPSKEAFILSCGPHRPNECMMIGDSLKTDIIGAKEAGLNVIYLNKNDEKTNYPSIKEITELKEIL
jgi:HAD superfamily hydrolase (TIGR01549 family)